MIKALTPQQAMAALKQKNYKPVYFLQGEEVYYIDLITTYIADHIISKKEKELNLSIVYNKKHTLEEIILQAQHLPILGEKKVIIIKEAHKLLDLQKTASKKRLIQYIQQPRSHTLLVFAYKNKVLDTTSELARALVNAGMLVNCKTPYSHQIPSWISQYVHERGYTIEEKEALALQNIVGNNLQVLANEMQKLFISLPKGSKIANSLIGSHLQTSRNFTLFDLQDALSSKETNKIMRIVESFTQNPKKHPIIHTINYLTNFFAKLLQLHHKSYQHASKVAQNLDIHPYLANSYVKAGKHYTLSQTLQNIDHLHQADFQAKGIYFSAFSEAMILKELITKLINPVAN